MVRHHVLSRPVTAPFVYSIGTRYHSKAAIWWHTIQGHRFKPGPGDARQPGLGLITVGDQQYMCFGHVRRRLETGKQIAAIMAPVD